MTTIAIVLQLIQLGLPIAQEIADAVNVEMALSGSPDGPTPEQQATIDAGLEAAHAALQAPRPSGIVLA